MCVCVLLRLGHTLLPTLFAADPGALLVRVEAVPVAAAASVPEARAALFVGVVVPLEHKLAARALVFGKLADVDGCGGGCGGKTMGDKLAGRRVAVWHELGKEEKLEAIRRRSWQ